MFETHRAATAETSLDEVVDRLRANPRVDGLLLAGSADDRTPNSDIDLVVLVADESVPQRHACTWIERCFTDLVFLTTAEADSIRSGAVPASLAADDGVRRWMLTALRDARILFDRSGRLEAARTALAASPPDLRPPHTDLFPLWDHLNYVLTSSRRYAGSADPLYRDAFALRMTSGPADAMVAYFAVRRLPWRGEKEALRYWQCEDPSYREAFLACLNEPDPARKLDLYALLVERCLAPVGPLWPEYQVSRKHEHWESLVAAQR
ncbi:MAG: nucleotidyltransferase domain-containing protein [Candidatus Latescibacterota bacterium]